MTNNNNNDFLTAFAKAAGLSREEADAQWAAHSRLLSDVEREYLEGLGESAGKIEGAAFRALYPEVQ